MTLKRVFVNNVKRFYIYANHTLRLYLHVM